MYLTKPSPPSHFFNAVASLTPSLLKAQRTKWRGLQLDVGPARGPLTIQVNMYKCDKSSSVKVLHSDNNHIDYDSLDPSSCTVVHHTLNKIIFGVENIQQFTVTVLSTYDWGAYDERDKFMPVQHHKTLVPLNLSTSFSETTSIGT